jgi:hypothetical protein
MTTRVKCNLKGRAPIDTSTYVHVQFHMCPANKVMKPYPNFNERCQGRVVVKRPLSSGNDQFQNRRIVTDE